MKTYSDYKENIVRQLNVKTGLDLVWEDFELYNPKQINGKTISVNIKPTVQGSVKFKGVATFRIDRMDISNSAYVYEWSQGAKALGTNLYFLDALPKDQAALIALVRDYAEVDFNTADFVVESFTPDAKGDVDFTLTARSDSLYYYGSLKITLTHPLVNTVTVECNPAKDVILTSPNTLGGVCFLDGVEVVAPYTIPAGKHEFTIRGFIRSGGGLAWVSPTKLKLLRMYAGTYDSLFRNATTLTELEQHSIHVGNSLRMYTTFQGCTNLVTLPNELFLPGSETTGMNGFFSGCGFSTVPATIFKNLKLTATVLDALFSLTTNLKTLPSGCLDPIAESVTTLSGLLQQSGVTSLPGDLLAGFTKLSILTNLCYGCVNLASLPADLLSYGSGYSSLTGCFRNCTGLRSIPAGFLDKLTSAIAFNYMFSGCSGITSVRADLLTKCVMLNQLNGLLMGTSITSVPATLVSTLTNLIYVESFFEKAIYLTAVPHGFFANNPRLSVVTAILQDCVGLVSFPDDLLDYTSALTKIDMAFCRVIIPFKTHAGMFKGNGITTAAQAFRDSGLYELTEDLMVEHTKVVRAENMYSGTKIKVLPKGALCVDSTTAWVYLTSLCENCTELTTIKTGALVLRSTNYTGGGHYLISTFAGCSALTTIEPNAVDLIARVTSFESFMSGCSAYAGSTSDLSKGLNLTLLTAATTAITLGYMFGTMSKLTGSGLELYKAMMGIESVSGYRNPKNFIEKDFLLSDYSELGNTWWTTPAP